MPQIANSKVTSSSAIDSISQEFSTLLIPTETSRDDPLADDIVPELCSAAEQAVNVGNFFTNCILINCKFKSPVILNFFSN